MKLLTNISPQQITEYLKTTVMSKMLENVYLRIFLTDTVFTEMLRCAVGGETELRRTDKDVQMISCTSPPETGPSHTRWSIKHEGGVSYRALEGAWSGEGRESGQVVMVHTAQRSG